MKDVNKLNDEKFMKSAISEAQKAYAEGEVPIGAVLIDEDGILICAEHNRIEQLDDATAHAEILLLRGAAEKFGRRKLSNCTIYVTVEPCPMCAGALVLSRLKRLVYGTTDSKFGACESLFNVTDNLALNHQLQVTAGVLENDCRHLMQKFFSERRHSNFPAIKNY